ncbi:MAG: TonB-dependent copper receptor [Pseudomonadota bacterium]|nr:MAG: TonB-dependent copper receptor [Pseudomonadota bacterium]
MNKQISGGLLAALACLSAWADDDRPVDAEVVETADQAGVKLEPAWPLVLEPVVVTTALMTDPYSVSSDPRQPRLPLPAHDGGSYLKSIPGFSLSRKGGTSGDPELRGLGGSRLNILLDDAAILGGCGGRMDPPTAYVYPESFDRIEVIKGPQSVRYGASASGVVHFDRDTPRFDDPEIRGYGSTTVGRFGRRDGVGEVTAGSESAYARLTGTFSEQDDYSDGNGREVHSRYQRWSAGGVFGWTPDENTLVEASIDRSDGEAAYDDRKMDGTRFGRSGYSLRARRANLSDWWRELEFMAYYNYVDHVMDNYTLREPPMMPMVGYPDRRTRGARLNAEFQPARDWLLSAGLDWSDNLHANNSLMGPAVERFGSVPREDNAEFTDFGAFVEASRRVSPRGRVTFGLRVDHGQVEALSEDGFGGVAPGTEDSDDRVSGFVRYSHQLASRPVTFYAGLGRAERSPDFWERRRVFALENEVLTQFDLGARYEGPRLTANLALFYGEFEDFILIAAPGQPGAEARNAEAGTYGGEADVRYRITQQLAVVGTLAWVRSDNDSDDRPLAQTPPLEGTLGLDFDDGRWFGGALWRAVASQDRIHAGHGTIYSLDTAETPGFAVLSVYGGRHFGRAWTLTGGIDNLFDRYYTGHLQRGSADLGAAASRIAEPGRSFWLRLSRRF